MSVGTHLLRLGVLLALLLGSGPGPGVGLAEEPQAPPAFVTVDEIEDAGAPWRPSLVPEAMRAAGSFRLAVVPVEFPDRAHDPRFTREALEELFFSRGTHRRTADGHEACGSLTDYYDASSYGAFRITGRVLAWIRIETPAERLLQMPMVNTGGLYREKALEALRARDGEAVLADFGGLCFIGAGDAGRRGRGLWPHRGKLEDRPYI